MVELGGVTPGNETLLRQPKLRELTEAFDALTRRVNEGRRAGGRTEVIVYYSGHADESGILLGGARYDYARLRQRIRDVPADVHIAIVDSCASGSFTRIKGGARKPPFLHDTSNQVQGFAFLSSSSADEDAYVSSLEEAGYVYRGESGIPGRDFFRRGDPRQYHIHLANIESDDSASHHRTPSLALLDKLAKAFKVSVADLLK